jgi:hypothetical protein
MLLFAGVFVAGTCYVIFNDVINGDPITTNHCLTALALLGAVVSGHMMASMFRSGRYVLSIGHLLLACATTFYVATMSGTRNSEQGAVKTHKVEYRNTERTKADSIIKIAEGELAELKKAEKDECKKVGPQCERKSNRTKAKEISLEDLRTKRAALGGEEIPNAGYKKVAEAIAIISGYESSQARIERFLILALPWAAVLIAELGTIVFSASALGHEVVVKEVSLAKLKADLPTVSSGGRGPGTRKKPPHFPTESDGKQEEQKVSNVVPFGPQETKNAVLVALAESEKPALTRTELGNLLGLNAVQTHRACLEVADHLVTYKQGKWLLTALKTRVVAERRAATA